MDTGAGRGVVTAGEVRDEGDFVSDQTAPAANSGSSKSMPWRVHLLFNAIPEIPRPSAAHFRSPAAFLSAALMKPFSKMRWASLSEPARI
jgi:hypothetical protein